LNKKDFENKFQLVITFALEREVPKQWLQEMGYPVFKLKALKSGALNLMDYSDKGILFVITGLGLDNSREAAFWIRDNVNPLYVVNIGTAGHPSKEKSLGSWIIPNQLKTEIHESISLNDCLPFPWPNALSVEHNGLLCSLRKLKSRDQLSSEISYVDMEAYAQAQVFGATEISFHVLKYITDFSDELLKADFIEYLALFNEQIKIIFEFLILPQELDVSVVIPVFNREKSILDCVQSVVNQTLKPKDIIVVNDGSTDGTKEILDVFKGQIRVIDIEKNKGVSFARNLGVSVATTKWISFLDSDDLWEPNKLENQWQFWRRYPFYEIFQSDEIWIRNGTRVNACKHHAKQQGWVWKDNLRLCLISPSGVMLTKALLGAYNGFNESLPACEDYDLWIRITRNNVVGFDSVSSVIKYGGHSDQLSRKYDAIDRFRVKALFSAYNNEEDMNYKSELVDVLNSKLNILIQGSKKRNNYERVDHYESIKTQIGIVAK
jgi:glycosyltransferase involved in cell wall biosynthesis/nucleoside phosphorylase